MRGRVKSVGRRLRRVLRKHALVRMQGVQVVRLVELNPEPKRLWEPLFEQCLAEPKRSQRCLVQAELKRRAKHSRSVAA